MKRSAPLRRSQPIARADHKLYRCKAPGCPARFLRMRPMQEVCSAECAITLTGWRNRRAEEKRKADACRHHREARERQKRLSDLTAEAQKAFNEYVRLRDISAGHGCIDCGRPFGPPRPGGAVDAGHYLSRGSAPHLRFDERNVFAQRKDCNRPGGATRDAFRAGVIARIGLGAVEALEADQEPRRLRHDDLRAIRDDYRAKVRAMKKEKAE